MSSYSESKIYSIKTKNSKKCYIGSTIQDLHIRFIQHRSAYKTWLDETKQCKQYCYSYEVFKENDAYIELVEVFNGESKKELEIREEYIIRNTEDTVNKRHTGIQIRKSEVRDCPCGSKATQKCKHDASIKHKEYMLINNIITPQELYIRKTILQKNNEIEELKKKLSIITNERITNERLMNENNTINNKKICSFDKCNTPILIKDRIVCAKHFKKSIIYILCECGLEVGTGNVKHKFTELHLTLMKNKLK